MARITLDIKSIENDFFEGQSLLALSAPGLPDYRLCWMLNHYLDFYFLRQPEMDIPITPGTKARAAPADDLFAGITESQNREEFYFPVYQHTIPGTDSSIFLYGNKCVHQVLITEMPEADFFILYPGSSLHEHCQRLAHCRKLKNITWMKKIPVGNLKSRAAFIL
ncbi:MAG TPA: hypothetical protein VFL76_10225 [Edaphocola sp.]|nr:hypothetical protein [Edaphocola sp.]